MTTSPTPQATGSASAALVDDSRTLRRTHLLQGWTVRALASQDTVPAPVEGAVFEADVPGCVHTDLMAAGILDDPYLDQNETQQAWIGKTSWRYTCTFDAETLPPDSNLDLVCEGLDTIATLRLNGQEIGRSENMHVRSRFRINDAVRSGRNELQIDFEAPLPYALAMEERLGKMPYEGYGSNPPLPHNMMRKMACNFGWDWGPALITSGIWRPIYLESWTSTRVADVRPLVRSADAAQALVDVRVDLDHSGTQDGTSVHATLLSPQGDEVASAQSRIERGVDEAAVSLSIDRPALWWPVGYGPQPLYRLRVRLMDSDGKTLQRVERRIGLRTSRLVTTPDQEAGPLGQGSTFHLEVNGKRVYCKGANWIPDDCFPSRVTPERYRRQVKNALDANMNMLRVWGGGIYEDHAFYDACDEMGVLVWQDFLCACACYHESEPFLSWFEAEARDNVARLSAHASLVLWNGCNENVLGVHAWGEDWRRLFKENKPWGLHYYTEVFPGVLDELDPTKPYWPASPYSGSPDIYANTEEHGNCHIWDVWNGQGDCRNYLSHYPRFASEFGFHGPPTWPTIATAIPKDQHRFDSPTMVFHNRHAGGQALANERMGDYFDPPEDFNDWLFLAQVVQARSVAMGVEWFRALSPWNSGSLYWQLNDNWPVASWSAIDGYQRRKPLWYATRRFLADRLVTIRPAEPVPVGEPFGPLAVYLHNDSPTTWTGELHVAVHRVNRPQARSISTHVIDLRARDSGKFALPPDLSLGRNEFLVANIGGERAFWFPHPDREMAYPDAKVVADVTRRGRTTRVALQANTLVRDLCLFADRLDPEAHVSDQLITMLPGERVAIEVESDRVFDPAELTSHPVLQCVNGFGRQQDSIWP